MSEITPHIVTPLVLGLIIAVPIAFGFGLVLMLLGNVATADGRLYILLAAALGVVLAVVAAGPLHRNGRYSVGLILASEGGLALLLQLWLAGGDWRYRRQQGGPARRARTGRWVLLQAAVYLLIVAATAAGLLLMQAA